MLLILQVSVALSTLMSIDLIVKQIWSPVVLLHQQQPLLFWHAMGWHEPSAPSTTTKFYGLTKIPTLRQAQSVVRIASIVFFVGWAISRCLSTTPHPIWGQGGSILLVHCCMLVLKPAILIIMAVVRHNHTTQLFEYVHEQERLQCFTGKINQWFFFKKDLTWSYKLGSVSPKKNDRIIVWLKFLESGVTIFGKLLNLLRQKKIMLLKNNSLL